MSLQEMKTDRIMEIMRVTCNEKDIFMCQAELANRGYTTNYDSYVGWILC